MLQAAGEAERIDRRGDYGADFAGAQVLYLADHGWAVVARKEDAIVEPAILRGRGEAARDTVHELALVVLREGERFDETGRHAASRCLDVERGEHRRQSNAGRAVLRTQRDRARGKQTQRDYRSASTPTPAA